LINHLKPIEKSHNLCPVLSKYNKTSLIYKEHQKRLDNYNHKKLNKNQKTTEDQSFKTNTFLNQS